MIKLYNNNKVIILYCIQLYYIQNRNYHICVYFGLRYNNNFLLGYDFVIISYFQFKINLPFIHFLVFLQSICILYVKYLQIYWFVNILDASNVLQKLKKRDFSILYVTVSQKPVKTR